MGAYLDTKPVLAGKGILGLLLETLLTLRQPLVPRERLWLADESRRWENVIIFFFSPPQSDDHVEGHSKKGGSESGMERAGGK